jgi:hypothetical protein
MADNKATTATNTNSKMVDEAFQRLYGYAWGSKTDDATIKFPQELVDIFGSKDKVSRILRLPSIFVGNSACKAQPKNAAMLLTKRIVTANSNKRKATVNMANSTTDSTRQSFKRMRLSKEDYQNIELPKDFSAGKNDPAKPIHPTFGAAPAAAAAAAMKPASQLDSVLQQIAGQKKQNTVEKTSDDWETFKEKDKQLQDELELQAQSKNAYLVKQDFLNRVDQRRFEIEKEERDQERSRRQLAQASSKK